MKRKSLLIFLLCYFAYASIYVARLNLTVASPAFLSAGVMTTAQIGMLGSVFSVIYSVGRLFNGGVSDRQPPWRMICTGLAIAGISNIAIGFLPPFIGIFLLWSANAYAQSMLWSSMLRIMTTVFDAERRSKITSYLVTCVAAGNIAGILINTVVISKLGLGFAFVVPGALTLTFGLLTLLFLRRIQPEEVPAAKHIPMFRLLCNRAVLAAAAPAMIHGAIRDNVSLWMTVYFVDRYSIDLKRSALFVLFIPAVGFIGRMLYPLCYRLCGERENRVNILSFIVCAAAAAAVCSGAVPPVAAAAALGVIYAAVSMINTTYLSIFPMHFSESGNVASVCGIMDFVTYLGAGVGSFIYGFVIHSFGYTPMFISWVILSLASVILLLAVRRRTA